MILCDGATLTTAKGIGVGYSATLNIYGQAQDTGKIDVNLDSSNKRSACIGGNDSDCGNIRIHGGTFSFADNNESNEGAGVGAGHNGDSSIIDITGGSVIAGSKSGGAGIGGANTVGKRKGGGRLVQLCKQSKSRRSKRRKLT